MMMKSVLMSKSSLRHHVRHMSGLHANILETIGRTPVVKINKISPRDDVEIYAKVRSHNAILLFFKTYKKNKTSTQCEFFNPLSSVKDRLAVAIVEEAEVRF